MVIAKHYFHGPKQLTWNQRRLPERSDQNCSEQTTLQIRVYVLCYAITVAYARKKKKQLHTCCGFHTNCRHSLVWSKHWTRNRVSDRPPQCCQELKHYYNAFPNSSQKKNNSRICLSLYRYSYEYHLTAVLFFNKSNRLLKTSKVTMSWYPSQVQ